MEEAWKVEPSCSSPSLDDVFMDILLGTLATAFSLKATVTARRCDQDPTWDFRPSCAQLAMLKGGFDLTSPSTTLGEYNRAKYYLERFMAHIYDENAD
ncbi:hypothetical protein PAXRUDRAFT_14628 [Paxillus rubicundulus Ve08.2h10]|uniref:Uncharacterized protein n=1 Tax=Paxillus rubicundulus Ve08.2h10 TaxID=930991 RepID=A0A0D0DSX2_9AGAM|nr:hypothetical protein PAXRUDRAFT_14628 [Paxillus rubicundulus Ve08.2h10]